MTKLDPSVKEKDLEKEFGKYGRIKNVNLKTSFAFIEYYHKEDAKDAIKELNNKKLFGLQKRVVVEEAYGNRRDRERGRNRERERKERERYRRNQDYSGFRGLRKTGPKKNDICFSCGRLGHWANECTYPKVKK